MIQCRLEGFPSAREERESERQGWRDGKRLDYTEPGAFARQPATRYGAGQPDAFEQVFDLIEELLREGDGAIEPLVVSLREDLPNIASHHPPGYGVFEAWLYPESLLARRELEKLWEGKATWPA